MIKYNLKSLILDKEFKENRKVTYDDITGATGISRQTLSHVASKRGHNVTAEIIEKLCRYFKCTPNDLMTIVPDPEEGEEGENRERERNTPCRESA